MRSYLEYNVSDISCNCVDRWYCYIFPIFQLKSRHTPLFLRFLLTLLQSGRKLENAFVCRPSSRCLPTQSSPLRPNYFWRAFLYLWAGNKRTRLTDGRVAWVLPDRTLNNSRATKFVDRLFEEHKIYWYAYFGSLKVVRPNISRC